MSSDNQNVSIAFKRAAYPTNQTANMSKAILPSHPTALLHCTALHCTELYCTRLLPGWTKSHNFINLTSGIDLACPALPCPEGPTSIRKTNYNRRKEEGFKSSQQRGSRSSFRLVHYAKSRAAQRLVGTPTYVFLAVNKST
mmetsp:Transcript_29633/g.47830  ORF Transcript_29633/g.47830 Transcript_29633/m.47830 type:complete len:141 (-) Transcript_29633:682-1104(-)